MSDEILKKRDLMFYGIWFSLIAISLSIILFLSGNGLVFIKMLSITILVMFFILLFIHKSEKFLTRKYILRNAIYYINISILAISFFVYKVLPKCFYCRKDFFICPNSCKYILATASFIWYLSFFLISISIAAFCFIFFRRKEKDVYLSKGKIFEYVINVKYLSIFTTIIALIYINIKAIILN